MENHPSDPSELPPPPTRPGTPDVPPPVLNTPSEVTPLAADAPLPIAARHERTVVEDWLLRNLAPLLVIVAALSVEIVSEVLIVADSPVATPAVTDNPRAAVKKKPSPMRQAMDNAMSELPFKIPPQAWLALWIFVMLGYIATTFPEVRALLDRVFRRNPARPLPALRLIDLIAILSVYVSATRILALLVLGRHPLNGGEERAAALILNAAGLGLGLLSGILLARHRARHPRGSNGIWPFWTLPPADTRSAWWDVLIGVLAYPPSMMVISLCGYVNHTVVYLLGRRQDEHPLMNDLIEPQGLWVLAVFFVMATAGAAFFEEMLFRGVLYNIARRYAGPVLGACVAGFIFAILHRIESQVLGLFVLALILTFLYDRTGRLIAGMTLHAVNNLVALTLTLLASSHFK